METIGALLQPHRRQLQQLAIALSCVKLLRGLGLVFRMKSDRCNEAISIRPLLGALLLAALGMRLAQLGGDRLMLKINGSSLALNLVFLGMFYGYATPAYKRRIWRRTLLIGLLIGICLSYSLIQPELATVKRHLSIMMTATTCLLIVMGLLQRPGAVLGCLISIMVATSKLLYALAMLNTFMWYQNLLVLCLDLLRVAFALTLRQRGTAFGDSHQNYRKC
ncbi:uncharacterized protein [Drosophila virilis]|uniref:Uncharacterized protein n=1 Tax=Drosophila virilis TaxID=7244 RepID=B4M7D5_DROVI|nr:uncharacterized protein LOC6633423 [Drosophila virilis]EDW62702.1 uncharacterized protein Dvir_GJ16474 [Drosophila virilis]